MTMKEWNKHSTVPIEGCWVLDTDGYAYWSQKLPAEKATSLLLNTLTINDIDESYYYGLSVNMEAVTESDVEHWINGTKLSGQDKAPSQASKDAAAILKGLSSGYVKITSAMKATAPSANEYDDNGDGYLTKEQNKKYEKAVAEVTVTSAVTAINAATVGDAIKDIVTIDGVEWRVLSKTAEQAELITKDMVTAMTYHNAAPYPTWGKSDIRAYLNGDYYAGLSEGLKAMIKEEVLKTPKAFDALADVEETIDRVYLLGEGITSDVYDSTVVTPGGKVLAKGAEQLMGSSITLDGQDVGVWWLRTPSGNRHNAGSVIVRTSNVYANYVIGEGGVRPAITVKLK